jgi:hypothetical protein
MQRNRGILLLLPLLVAGLALCSVPGLAATPFAITAANLTMPAYDPATTSGGATEIHMGSSPFTVTGIREGSVTISCQYSGPATQAKIPQMCGIVGPGQVQVQSGETTFSGVVYFVPYGEGTVPGLVQLHSEPRPAKGLPISTIALAGVLMLGLGFRRRARYLPAVIAACAWVGIVGITGCGTGTSNTMIPGSKTMTPGSYPYTLSANFVAAGSSGMQPETATTTITLTVQ